MYNQFETMPPPAYPGHRAVARRFKQGGVRVKFADKPCSERMAIVQSCQVQMIKNLEVVGAFSAKKIFGHTKIFRDNTNFQDITK